MSSTIYKKHANLFLGLFLYLFFNLFAQSMSAQTYPVQANVHLVAPYGKHLNDYYATSNEKLVVTLLNKDQLKPTVEVRLRMTISAANGLKIQSKENVNYPTITLDAGIPSRLTQDDLTPYFKHIISSGYFDQGKLPDGQVEFTFQVIEKYTGKILSAPSTARAWLTTQKPPVLRFPSNNQWMAYSEHMHQKFQWEPQHKNLSQVEYEFELRELPDYGAAPQSSFLYAPVIHQERLLYTNLMYDVMMPPLESNKLYGWRVRAIAKDGVDELNMFENNGFSEVFWFRTGDNCPAPIGVKPNLEDRKLDLSWIPDLLSKEFIVQYRPKYGTADEDWKEVKTDTPNATIYDITRGVTYEYRVGAICSSGEPFYSTTGEISVPKVDSTRLLNCGLLAEFDIQNTEPLPELKIGDVIHLSDYPMTVTQASGSQGSFTGEGWVPVNWLLETKWAVEFSNITVNTDYKLIGGSVRAKYDENEGNIANVDEITEGGGANTMNGIVRADVTLTIVIPPNPEFTYNEETGEVLVFDTSGGSQVVKLPKGNDGKVVFPVTVEDANGDLHKIDVPRDEEDNPIVDDAGNLKTDANGNVALESTYLGNQGKPLAEGSFDPKNISPDVAIVTFSKGDGKYAFDTWIDKYKEISKIVNQYEHLGGKDTYHVPWKLLPSGTSDVVKATLEVSKKSEEKNFDPEKVMFITPQGTTFKADYNSKNKAYSISLVSGKEEDVQEIYALYPKKGSTEQFYTIGKLKVVTYRKQEYKVVVVPIDGKDVDETKLTQYLDEVYGTVGVTWTVVKESKFNYTGVIKEFFKESSKFLSAYNQNMKELQSAYEVHKGGLDKDAKYLFIMNKSGSEAGFMPLGKRYGYIFTGESSSGGDVYHTIAHELGHGRWNLSHTFDKTYGAKLGEKDTDNLMSYSGGTHLAKWQWDVIDKPSWFTNPLDGDEKGMIVIENHPLAITRILKAINCAKQKNQLSVKLYIPTSNFRGKVNDISNALNNAGHDCGSAYVKIMLLSMFGEANGSSHNYFVDEFDISDIKFDANAQFIQLKGKKYTLSITSEYPKDNKCVHTFVKAMLESNLSLLAKYVESYSFDDWQYESICSFEQLSIAKRKELLSSVLTETNWFGLGSSLKDSRQIIVLNLINSTPNANKKDLYTYLKENIKLLNNLYDKVDDYREDFIIAITNLWNENEDSNKEPKVLPLTQFSLGHSNSYLDINDSGYYEFSQSYIIGGDPHYSGVQYGYKHLGTFQPFDPVYLHLSSTFSSIFLGANTVYKKIPAIMTRSIYEDTKSDEFWNYVSLTTATIGIGQMRLGVQLAATNVKSINAWITLGLGMADVATYPIEDYVKTSPNSEFSKMWVENRMLIYGTLLVGNVADAVYKNYANKAKQLEDSYRKETGKEIGEAVGKNIRKSWDGYKNIFVANTDEITEATTRLKNHRISTNNLKGGNYGYLEGVVEGKVVENKLWRSVSRVDAEKEIHIFTATEVEGTAGSSWLRITDSEYRMLNKLADDLGGQTGKMYPKIKGEIKIISENPYCQSCQGVIQQFHEMYPNIKLILVDGIK